MEALTKHFGYMTIRASKKLLEDLKANQHLYIISVA